MNDQILQLKIDKGKLETKLNLQKNDKENHNLDIKAIKEDYEQQIEDLERDVLTYKKEAHFAQTKEQDIKTLLEQSRSKIKSYEEDMKEYRKIKKEFEF